MKYMLLNYLIWLAGIVVGSLLGTLIWEFLVRYKNGCRKLAEDMKKYDGLGQIVRRLLIAIPSVVIVPFSSLLCGKAFELFPGLLKWLIWCCVGIGVIAALQFIVGMIKFISSVRHGY